ncbi:MAG: endonuclease/exonuclease/phosphatase family protein [Kofleriaceae bacterium]
MKVLLVFAWLGCGTADRIVTSNPEAQPAQPIAAGAVKLRVMTYNVNFGLRGDRAGVDAAASASPDLVMLQETTPEWETAFVDGLGARFPHHRFQAPGGRWAAGGMGMLSRWPIVALDTIEGGGGPFFAHRAIVDAPGGQIQILNLHLRPPMSDGGSWVVGFFSTRGDREREAKHHITKLDLALPTIIVGDFNEEDEGMAIAVFKQAGFASALPQFQPNADTWQWPVSDTVTLRFRLDHVLYSKHFRALSAAVVDAGRSDHAPVWADLERVR